MKFMYSIDLIGFIEIENDIDLMKNNGIEKITRSLLF